MSTRKKQPGVLGGPNWDHWGDLKRVPLWCAVALSCDIEPTTIEAYGGGLHPNQDKYPPEFARRLNVAISEATELGAIQTMKEFYHPPHERTIELDRFLAWSQDRRQPWALPSKMSEWLGGRTKEAEDARHVDLAQGHVGEHALANHYARPEGCCPASSDADISGVDVDSLPASRPSRAFDKPVQRSQAQNEVILSAIREAGHEPQKLPKNISGKPGVKAAIRAKVVRARPDLFPATGRVFDKAWERLRANGDVADGDD